MLESRLLNLFLTCKNTEVLAESHAHLSQAPENIDPEVIQKRIAALIELLRSEEIVQENILLKTVLVHATPEAQYYAEGRFAYFARDFVGAKAIFQKLESRASSLRDRLRAHFGLANCALLLEEKEIYDFHIGQLENESAKMRPDEALPFYLLKARYHRVLRQDTSTAKRLYNEAINVTMAHGWTYHLLYALFGLALCAYENGATAEASMLHALLMRMIPVGEMPYLLSEVTRGFPKLNSIGEPIFRLDPVNATLHWKGETIGFVERPMIFGLLCALTTDGEKFITKEDLARALWPREEYHPFVHDPRIFDLVKRARCILNKLQDTNLSIISGRMGYRLMKGSKNEILHKTPDVMVVDAVSIAPGQKRQQPGRDVPMSLERH